MLRYVLPILLLTGMVFLGCPDKKTAESEKGRIEKWTDKTAEKAVDALQGPIDKARAVKGQADDRSRDMTDKAKDPTGGPQEEAVGNPPE